MAKHSPHGRYTFGKRKCFDFSAYPAAEDYSLVGFSFMICPLLNSPPDIPLPDPIEYPEWYGEIWIKYPFSQTLSPSFFGEVFRAKCQFRVIMNEYCLTAYSKGSEPGVTLDKAN